MADAPEFKQPTPHVPDGVVGDTLDEVETPFVQPPAYEPDPPDSLFVQGVYEHPYQHTSPFVQPPSHVPGGVIGDTLDEVRQPPPLSTPTPPLEPQDVPTPDPHVPGGVVGDTLDEVAQPPDPGTPVPAPDPVPFGETPMPPPAEPQDVSTPPPHVADDDPQAPDIAVIRDHRIPDPPADALLQRDAPRHRATEYEELAARLRETDEKLAGHVRQLGDDGWTSLGLTLGAGSGMGDPFLHAKIYQNYITQVGPAGVATFTALQTALHAMNAKYGKVFNVFYMNLPLSPTRQNVTLDTYDKVHSDFVAQVDDPLAQEQARLGEGPLVRLGLDNTSSPDHPHEDGGVFNHGAFVDLALPKDGFGHPQATLDAREVSVLQPFGQGMNRRVIDHSRLFDQRTGRLKPEFGASSPTRKSRDSEALAASSFNWRGSRGVVPASFDVEDEEFGYVSGPLPDDVTYVPLLFQDLRPGPDGKTRHVYLRALNLQTSEAIVPNWNEEEAFGRVDPVMGYRSTNRSLNISFMCYAFTPEDLPVIYKKRAWLSSMTYPEISSDLLLRSGPVVRVRVGDLYNNSQGGLPGVIKDLNYDDSEQTWELKRGYKVPRGFSVSLSFQVLHEGTPGISGGHFTTVRATIPNRRPDDPSRFDSVKVESDDGLFARITPPRRKG